MNSTPVKKATAAAANWGKLKTATKSISALKNKNCPSAIPAIALLVTLIITSAYVAPIHKNIPQGGWFFTAFHLLIGLTIIPYIIELVPVLAKPEWQLAVAIFVAVLDWVSLLEDKSRYSENTDFCLTGSLPSSWGLQTCRKNAFVTGVIAHIADTVGIYLIGSTLIATQSKHMGWLFLVIMLIYAVAGGYYIWTLTKDGGPSDIRDYVNKKQAMGVHLDRMNDDDPKNNPTSKDIMNTYEELNNTKNKPRLWSDFQRGTLNLVITYLGVLAAWQVIFNEIPDFQDNCLSWEGMSLTHLPGVFPIQKLWESIRTEEKSLTKIGKLFSTIILFVLPNNANLLNTSYQYSAPSNEIGLEDFGNLKTS